MGYGEKVALLVSVLVLLTIIAITAFADEMGSVDVSQGNLASFDVQSAPYGAVAGTVKFRLGNWTWYPQEIWLVPEGVPDDYKAMSRYYQISSSVSDPILNKTNSCKTSLYNLTEKRAYKALQIGSDGTFCILADSGRYKIYAK
jgi:hypothetical protein